MVTSVCVFCMQMHHSIKLPTCHLLTLNQGQLSQTGWPRIWGAHIECLDGQWMQGYSWELTMPGIPSDSMMFLCALGAFATHCVATETFRRYAK